MTSCDFHSGELLEKALDDAANCNKLARAIVHVGWDWDFENEPIPKYESPIEILLACALDVSIRLDALNWQASTEFGLTHADCVEVLDASTAGVGMFSQVKIEPYTVDFMFLYRHRVSGEIGGIVVECDGHAFHERTKEQAAHDKSRDRFLQSEGFKVLRFTGSEIWNKTYDCVNEIVRTAWKAGAPLPAWHKDAKKDAAVQETQESRV